MDMGIHREDTALLVMPMCHANSLYFFVRLHLFGAACVIDDHKSFDPRAALARTHVRAAGDLHIAPANALHHDARPARRDEANVRRRRVSKLMISSRPHAVTRSWRSWSTSPTPRLFELYGSTEAGWVTLLRPDEQLTKLGSVGREWTGSVRSNSSMPDGNEVPDGEVGELYSADALRLRRVLEARRRPAEAFRGDWCTVGRRRNATTTATTSLVGRKSNVIIRGASNIYPSEIEDLLGAHPAWRTSR